MTDEMRKWGVYCKDGHACVGPFDTELEALSIALGMTQEGMGQSNCIYDTIPLFLITGKPSGTTEVRPKGGYL